MRDWKKWIRAAGVRAIKMVAQTVVGCIGASAVLSDVSWPVVTSAVHPGGTGEPLDLRGGAIGGGRMSLNIRENLADFRNYRGDRREFQIKYLVLLYTGNDGDTTERNAKYYHTTVAGASAHYFVEDQETWWSVPELRIAWAVGRKKWADCPQTGGGTMHGTVTNTNSFSVELCDTRKDGVYGASEETLTLAAELCRDIMKRYDIPPEQEVRHFDVTGKHCPAYMMDPEVWAAFKVWLGLDNTPSPAHKEGVEWAVENEILRGNATGDLMLSKPLTREQFCTMLKRYDQNRKD